MKKKVLSILLALSLCLGMLPAQALAADEELPVETSPAEDVLPEEETPPAEDDSIAADTPVLLAENSGTCGEKLTWTFDEGTGTLTVSGTGEMKDYSYVRPPWNSIASTIKKVIIGDGVTSIGGLAFDNCSGLTSVVIGNGVKTIERRAFGYCRNLTSAVIGNGVKTIGNGAFQQCEALTDVTIPDSVTSIEDHAFYSCSGLTSAVIGKGAITIGDFAFYGCKGLTGVTIPDSVTSIGNLAFEDCIGLTSVVIGSGVTSIGKSAFGNCSKLTSVVIGKSVKTIGETAFHGCKGLTGVTIPGSVTSMGDNAFAACSGLTSVVIGNGVKTIGYGAFSECGVLTGVTIPDSVTSIEGFAFYNCRGLTSITIPDSVTSIGYNAFYGCMALTSITIPVSVTSIGNFAFNYCNNLKELYYAGSWEQWNTIQNNNILTVFTKVICSSSGPDNIVTCAAEGGNIYFDKVTGTIIKCDTDITSVDIPYKIEGVAVKAIGHGAFEGCTSLEYAVIQGGAESIGGRAFYGCTKLKRVQIPESVQGIGDSAFEECSALDLVVLGRSIASIGERAFANCKKLLFIALPEGLTEIKKQTFSGCAALENIKIPGSVSSIDAGAFDSCTGLHNVYYGGTKLQWDGIMIKLSTPSQYLEKACVYTWKHFSFSNTDKDFFSDDELNNPESYTYPMTDSHREHFKTILEKEYGDESKVAAEFEALCKIAANRTWGGSCYGISAVEGMVNHGLLPVTAIDSHASELADVAFPYKDHSVRSLMNYYYISQKLPIPRYNGAAQQRMTDSAEGKKELEKLINLALAGEECMFNYYNADMGHTFIVEAGRQMPDGSYELYGRDNRFHGATYSTSINPDDPFDVKTGLPYVSTVKIPKDLTSCTVVTPYNQEEKVDAFFVISDFSLFADIDPTGEAVASAVSLYAGGAAEVPSFLYCLPGDTGVESITLEDANGNTLLSNLKAGSGVKDFWYAGGGSTVREVTNAEGNTVLEVRGTPPGLMIELDTSAGKVYTASNFDGTCAYIGPEGMAAVSVQDTNASAEIDLTKHTVTLTNNAGDFSIIVDDPGNSKAIAAVSGSTQAQKDTVTVSAGSDGDITLSAPEGTYDVTFMGDNGEEVTVPVAGGETEVKVENPAKLIPCDSDAYTADIEWNDNTFTVTLTGMCGNSPALTGWVSCCGSDGRLLSVKGLTGISTGSGTKFSGTVLKDGTYYLFIVDSNHSPIIRKYSLTGKFSL